MELPASTFGTMSKALEELRVLYQNLQSKCQGKDMLISVFKILKIKKPLKISKLTSKDILLNGLMIILRHISFVNKLVIFP